MNRPTGASVSSRIGSGGRGQGVNDSVDCPQNAGVAICGVIQSVRLAVRIEGGADPV